MDKIEQKTWISKFSGILQLIDTYNIDKLEHMDGLQNQDNNNKENTTILTVSPTLILLFVVCRKDGLGSNVTRASSFLLGLLGKRQKIDRFLNFRQSGVDNGKIHKLFILIKVYLC